MCDKCKLIHIIEDSRGNKIFNHYTYDLAGNIFLVYKESDAFKKGCIAFANHINNTKFDINTYIDYEYIDVSSN
jgi:hypothetical protein